MIHLHVHSQYSLLDGMCRIDKMINKAKSLDMNSIAITDHGVLYGILDFYKQCNDNDIKPIIGIEAYLTEDRTVQKKEEINNKGYGMYHLVLLAKNQVGYKNLLKISTDSFLNGFFSKPRTDLGFLRDHSEGIIALSACIAGQIPTAILQGDMAKARELAKEYQDIFGDDFYLELQANSMPEQEVINKALVSLGNELGIKLVVTCDAHYLNKEDARTHEVLLAAQTNQVVGSPKAMKFPCDDFYFKSEEEVLRDTIGVSEEDIRAAIKNTHLIADKCDVKIEFGNNLLPVFETPDGKSLEGYLEELCDKALLEYYLTSNMTCEEYENKYKERLKYELSIINGSGFAGYFLIVSDFMMWGKRNGIIFGPGRGSAASSLVSYLLKITDKNIDPLKYDLPFERFLNPERKEMPDIDIDVKPEHRQIVIEYIRNKYGADNVAQIGTLGMMKTKAVLKKIGGALGIDFSTRDSITKLIPSTQELDEDEDLDITTALLHSEELRRYKDQYPELFRIAEELEGFPSNSSIHAGGVVIAPFPVSDFAPLQLGSDDEIVTQFTMEDIARLGLLKVDVLGLKTLGVIENTLQMAREEFDDVPEVEDIAPSNDSEVFRMLCNGEIEGVFQIESDLFRKIIKDMQPQEFNHWVDLVALGRPGPLISGMVDQYCRRKNGHEAITYIHPKLENILKNTFQVIIFQEQVMLIARELAGYTMGQADKLRKIMGKKRADLLPAEREKFIKGCIDNGEDAELCAEIFDQMAAFAEYGFNKPHAVCYALTSYRTMWIKMKYPAQFMSAILTNKSSGNSKDKETKIKKLLQYINRARSMNIEILPPDINKSSYNYHAEGNNIRMGLVSISGVGKNAVKEIINNRPYTSISDFDSKVNNRIVNKKVVTSLIYAGAFDSICPNRNQLYKEYIQLRQSRGLDKKDNINAIPNTWTKRDIIENEVLYLGFPISVSTKWDKCKEGEYITIDGVISKIHERTTKNGKLMAFIDIDTKEGEINALFFLDQWGGIRERAHAGQSIIVNGKKSEGKLIAKRVKLEEDNTSTKVAGL